MNQPLATPITLGRSRSTSGAVNVVPELRSYRYEPRPARLSPMQMLVVQLVCCGLADKEIAFVLGMSSATVKAHMSRAIKDMGLYRRHQLVRYVFENGLFDPESAQAEILRRRAS
jgi:DNA-binding NarL/FixJ family response regulator